MRESRVSWTLEQSAYQSTSIHSGMYDGIGNFTRHRNAVSIIFQNTSQDLRVNVFNVTFRSVQQGEEELEVLDETSLIMKVNVSKQGYWVESKMLLRKLVFDFHDSSFSDELRHFQVIAFDGNFAVITLCDRTHLISFVLSNQWGGNVTSVRNPINDFLTILFKTVHLRSQVTVLRKQRTNY